MKNSHRGACQAISNISDSGSVRQTSTFRSMNITPDTPQEISECETIEGMRKRINQYEQHDAITRQVMMVAWHRGLSGEDKMTMLAFEALKRLEHFEKMLLEQAMLSTKPIIIQCSKEKFSEALLAELARTEKHE